MLVLELIHPDVIQQLLESNYYVFGKLRPKMVSAMNGEYIKFFYDQRGLHWSSFRPKARLFVSNAERLISFGLVAPIARRFSYCPETSAWIVIYPRLPGEDLRSIGTVDGLQGLAAYMARLHQHGVYFRGIHLGNVLMSKTEFGLIDIAGMTIWRRELNIWQRLRNIGRFLSFPEDVKLFADFGIERFVIEYCNAAGLVGWKRAWLTRAVYTRVEAAQGVLNR